MTTNMNNPDEAAATMCDGMMFRDSTGSTFEFRRDPTTGAPYAVAARNREVALDGLTFPLYLFD